MTAKSFWRAVRNVVVAVGFVLSGLFGCWAIAGKYADMAGLPSEWWIVFLAGLYALGCMVYAVVGGFLFYELEEEYRWDNFGSVAAAFALFAFPLAAHWFAEFLATRGAAAILVEPVEQARLIVPGLVILIIAVYLLFELADGSVEQVKRIDAQAKKKAAQNKA